MSYILEDSQVIHLIVESNSYIEQNVYVYCSVRNFSRTFNKEKYRQNIWKYHVECPTKCNNNQIKSQIFMMSIG